MRTPALHDYSGAIVLAAGAQVAGEDAALMLLERAVAHERGPIKNAGRIAGAPLVTAV